MSFKMKSLILFTFILISISWSTTSFLPPATNYKEWTLFNGMTLPNHQKTVTWCTFHKAPPISQKQHIVGYDNYKPGQKETEHTHHVDIYRCSAPPGVDPVQFFEPLTKTKGGNCEDVDISYFKQFCRSYFEWCFACRFKMYPDSTGIPISPNEYVMMSAHFENPQQKENVYVESGMKFYYSDELRKFDSGHFLIGQDMSWTEMIPPNSKIFVLTRHCSTKCTKNLPHPVNLISYTYHAHASAKQIRIRHFRQGLELPLIAINENYNPNEIQHYRQLKVDNEVKR